MISKAFRDHPLYRRTIGAMLPALRAFRNHRHFRPVMGAFLTGVCGLALWTVPAAERWRTASYDDLFRFGVHPVTNDVVVILMDNDSYDHLGQTRTPGTVWDRGLHARLLNKLADDHCPLVVLDVRLEIRRNPESDKALADAMNRLANIVLSDSQVKTKSRDQDSDRPILPNEFFLRASKTNWGVGWLDADPDGIVRRDWPFPDPGSPHPSLPRVAARLSGTPLNEEPSEKWIRYYGQDRPFGLSYHVALTEPPGYFRDKVVFIGNDPAMASSAEFEQDKFKTPLTLLTGEAVGGVQILATIYLNLVNGDWLRRPAPVVEGCLVVIFAVLGGSLCFFRRVPAAFVGLVLMLFVTIGAAYVSYHANVWFPWLIVVGGQIPCALVWSFATAKAPKLAAPAVAEKTEVMKDKEKTIALRFPEELAPAIPNYKLVDPPFGRGGFGKVWLARNALDQWQAIKVIYRAKFEHPKPYEAEFNGLRRYKPVSEEHAGLLRVELVSEQLPEGYFYYVMELGDSQNPGWELSPERYKPKDLEYLRKLGALPVRDCVRICIHLAETLAFLHERNLIHRDIKPSNVIFVKGRPKLADVGLVSEARRPEEVQTFVGTYGYLPPPPEPPGTVQADIYALGKLLYVISTGCNPDDFPGIKTTLMERSGHLEFMRLNSIILKACQPDIALRYKSAAEMLVDLKMAAAALDVEPAI